MVSFTGGDSQVLLVIGDGSSEEKVLRWAAPLFNGGTISIAYPSPPPIGAKLTGLSALETLVKLLNGGLDVKHTLFVLDREHLSSLSDLERWLVNHGFSIEWKEEDREGRAAKLRLARGHRVLNLYVAIMGKNRCLEEEVEEFNSRMLGVKDRRLRREAFEKARRRDIEACFRGLSWALNAIEAHVQSRRARS